MRLGRPTRKRVAVSIEIRGAEQLAALAKSLKQAGDKELQRELAKAVNSATKPIKDAAKQSALRTLPKRGGLNKRVANSKFTTRRRAGARIAGVRVEVKSDDALGMLDKGTVRHPVHGNRDVWVTQRVTPGWWTDPTEALAPQARRDLEAAMRAIAAKIERRR
jgi:hypothetical protein